MSSDKNNTTIPQKFLDKIIRLEQNQEEKTIKLEEILNKTNKLLEGLTRVTETGSTIAARKKIVPFQTVATEAGYLADPPSNPDGYPTIIDIYAQNDNKTIDHMTLINDGPGDVFYVTAYAKNEVNTAEGQLHINDARELFNVWEIRLRATQPLTTFRLIEGIFRTGGFSPFTKANVEIRPTYQPNEKSSIFRAIFDNKVPTLNITSPTVQTFPVNYIAPGMQNPLPPGATCALVSVTTRQPMPFTIPESFSLEIFASVSNISTNGTMRTWFQFIPGTYTLNTMFPISARGYTVNFMPNLSVYNTLRYDPKGAPVGGRNFILTFTNDDPVNNTIGEIDVFTILRRMV